MRKRSFPRATPARAAATLSTSWNPDFSHSITPPAPAAVAMVWASRSFLMKTAWCSTPRPVWPRGRFADGIAAMFTTSTYCAPCHSTTTLTWTNPSTSCRKSTATSSCMAVAAKKSNSPTSMIGAPCSNGGTYLKESSPTWIGATARPNPHPCATNSLSMSRPRPAKPVRERDSAKTRAMFTLMAALCQVSLRCPWVTPRPTLTRSNCQAGRAKSQTRF